MVRKTNLALGRIVGKTVVIDDTMFLTVKKICHDHAKIKILNEGKSFKIDFSYGRLINLRLDVELRVISVNKNQIKMFFSSPYSVTIYRKEIWDRIQVEKAAKKVVVISQKNLLAEKKAAKKRKYEKRFNKNKK